MAKKVVLVRTYNEIKHIDRFCKGYEWADVILLADGGSTDGTAHAASKYPNVKVRHFPEWVEINGFGRNPEGSHINFLVDWAHEENADWLILDDCDSVPNRAMKEAASDIFDNLATGYEVVYMYRMYIYGTTHWFPNLTGGRIPPPKGTNESTGKPFDWYGMWAWKPGLNLRWEESNTENIIVAPNPIYRREARNYFIDFPKCLLHYFCIDEEEVEQKLQRYRLTWNVTDKVLRHPLEAYGPIEPLPGWAHP